jgi:ubiquinone/menaquinone biosynthesis C-methylase UbiE
MDQFQRPIGREGRIVAAHMNREHRNLTTWGLTHVTIQPDFTILDVGCGGGKTINRLAQMALQGKIYGVDYSPEMVAYAKKLNRKLVEQGSVEIVEGTADKTGLLSNQFDLVTAVETYYFWHSLPDAFREILRVLKPNGQFVLISEMIKDGVYEVEQAEMIAKTHVRLAELKEVCSFLKSAGFVRVEAYRKEGTAWNVVVSQKPLS